MSDSRFSFEYGTPYVTGCYGGIETVNCHEDAAWTCYVDGYVHALLCNGCKHEMETYISNMPITRQGW